MSMRIVKRNLYTLSRIPGLSSITSGNLREGGKNKQADSKAVGQYLTRNS